jgi:hypothetical protein
MKLPSILCPVSALDAMRTPVPEPPTRLIMSSLITTFEFDVLPPMLRPLLDVTFVQLISIFRTALVPCARVFSVASSAVVAVASALSVTVDGNRLSYGRQERGRGDGTDVRGRIAVGVAVRMVKTMLSAPAAALASRIACRRDPAPLLLVFVTVKSAAWAGLAVISSPNNRAAAMPKKRPLPTKRSVPTTIVRLMLLLPVVWRGHRRHSPVRIQCYERSVTPAEGRAHPPMSDL